MDIVFWVLFDEFSTGNGLLELFIIMLNYYLISLYDIYSTVLNHIYDSLIVINNMNSF